MAEKYKRNRFPGVEKVAGGYRARYTDATGTRRAKTFKVQSDAVRWRNEQLRAIDRGEWIEPTRAQITVEEAVDVWKSSKTNITEKTWATYESELHNYVLPGFGDTRINALRSSDIAVWMKEQVAAGAGVVAVNRAVGLLRQVLKLAVLDGRLQRNPADGVPRLSHTRAPRVFEVLTVEQLASLASACAAYEGFVHFAGLTGLRWGELAALRVGDIDLDRGTLTVARAMTTDRVGKLIESTTKTKQTRTIPLVDPLPRLLAPVMAGREPEALLFTSAKGGVLQYEWFMRRIWKPATIAAGLPGFTFHGLRRTCGSLLLSLQAPITTVSAVLGHASVRTTLEAYAHFYEDDKAAYLSLLGTALESASMNSKGTEKVLEASEPPVA